MQMMREMLKKAGRALALPLMATLMLTACSDKPGSPDAAQKADAAPADTQGAANSQGRAWATVLSVTPQNGFLMGNPDAKVHLIEYASLSCPHCADFHSASKDALKRDYIAKGLVKYEYRSFVLNPADLAASVLARCFGPERFFTLTGAFFEKQRQWFQPFVDIKPQDQQTLQSVPAQDQLKAYARLGKLDAFARQFGITGAQFDTCMTNPKLRAQLEAIQQLGTKTDQISGTPSFLINGKYEDDLRTWDAVDARLKSLVQ